MILEIDRYRTARCRRGFWLGKRVSRQLWGLFVESSAVKPPGAVKTRLYRWGRAADTRAMARIRVAAFTFKADVV